MMTSFLNTLKHLFDGVAVATTIAAFLNLIPLVSGLLSIVWLVYRIKEIRLSVKIKQAQLNELE